MYLCIIFLLMTFKCQLNLADDSNGITAGELAATTEFYIEAVSNQTLLDIKRDAIGFIWDIDTWPEKRQNYMKYWDVSSEIDKTYLNTTPEIDLSPFGGVQGIWVFPHSRRFGDEFYAYFNRIMSYNFFEKLEIFFYLHGQAELRYFNSSDTTNVSKVFRGNESIAPGWQSVEFNTTDNDKGTMTFRLEFHTHENGDFAFLDKIIGYYGFEGEAEAPASTTQSGTGPTTLPTSVTPPSNSSSTTMLPTTTSRRTTTIENGETQPSSSTSTSNSSSSTTSRTTTTTFGSVNPPPVNSTSKISSSPLVFVTILIIFFLSGMTQIVNGG